LSHQIIAWSGPAALLGGLVWALGAVLTALKPEGCIGADCDLPGRSMRAGGALDGVLFVAAVLLIAVGIAGIVIRARRRRSFGRMGSVGVVASLVGVSVLLIASLVQAFLFGGDFPYMPWLVIPSLVALVIGMLLLGVAILRAAVLPRWAGVLLIIGVIAMLGFNDQNIQALMAVPFGLAWMASGYALWAGHDPQPL
jgi:hypothetical protein